MSTTANPLPATTQEHEERSKAATAQADQRAKEQQEQAAEAQRPLDALHTEHGDTTIADQVVEKLAGIAAREVSGVYAMGSAAGRAISNLTQRLPGQTQPNVTGGVTVERGERQTAVDVSVVVDYGVSIVEVADNIRAGVIQSIEYATGLDVVEVNVTVTDVHLPEEDDSDDATSSTTTSTRLK